MRQANEALASGEQPQLLVRSVLDLVVGGHPMGGGGGGGGGDGGDDGGDDGGAPGGPGEGTGSGGEAGAGPGTVGPGGIGGDCDW